MGQLTKLFEVYGSVIVLDTETSGLSPENNQIIELSAVKLKPGASPVYFDYFIKLPAGERLSPEIVNLTGITDEILEKEGISPKEACDKFASLFSEEKILIVAYNAQFDMNFLFYFLAKHQKADLLKKINMLDALTVYKDRRPYPHKLENAIMEYGLSGTVVNSHRAIDDTIATVEVLKCMEDEEDDLHMYINLFGYNPKYGVSCKKIRSVTYIPQGYNNTVKLYNKK